MWAKDYSSVAPLTANQLKNNAQFSFRFWRRKDRPIALFTGFALLVSGLINLMVGFLAFFPGFFEAAVAQSHAANENDITLMALVKTGFGFYGLCHLLGGGLQLLGGSNVGSLRNAGNPLTLALLLLAALSLGLEAWGWFFKGSLTIFSIPGAVAGMLCLLLYVGAIQRDGA